jgi:hypothetical protein
MTPARLLNRYRNGYRTAKLINGMGLLSQILGVLTGLALSIGGFAISHNLAADPAAMEWVRNNLGLSQTDQEEMIIALGVAIGFTMFLILWLAGMVISAIGQMLKAILDTAVFSSPHLSDDEKLKAIS